MSSSETLAEEPLSPTAPDHYCISVRGFDDVQRAQQFGELLSCFVRELSCDFDLAALDGITVAYDYAQALQELDRGYENAHRLTPTESHVVGVAMTPSVLREAALKSHIVLNARFVIALEDPNDMHFAQALHIVAHECAHVEVTQRFNAAFPGVLLRRSHSNLRDAFRWQIITACWDEYAATRRSALYGRDPSDDYEDTFLVSLCEARQQADREIALYRRHADVNRVLVAVYGAYGNLMKFAAYHLGNIYGRNLTLADFPRTQEALLGHWFEAYFAQLNTVLDNIANSYGTWLDMGPFEALGDLADQVLAATGVTISLLPDGRTYAHIP
jgi:hypothetical protein